jgi:hypothetical protein
MSLSVLTRFCVVLSLLLPGSVSAGDYAWPTNASHYMTSSFAEYRPGHFHAGIDIKTWNREGYTVFAIQDGYIWQVRVSPFGYGRVLYQKLNTGETIVYAHLKEFTEALEQSVRQEQKRTGEYRISKYFDPERFPVRKGDVIAYTGSSGIGKPHLHFEVRDKNNCPMNPLLLGYDIEDTISPGVSGFSMTPLNSDSRINGDARQTIFQPKLVRNGEYVIKDVPLLEGRIGFAVDCWDKANGVGNVFAIYRFNFYVDNELKYSAVYDRFCYDVSESIDLDRDYRLNKRDQGLFQKVYREVGNELPFYNPPDFGSGVVICHVNNNETVNATALHEFGPHHYVIELLDFNSNLTTLRGEFNIGRQQRIKAVCETDDRINYDIVRVTDDAGIEIPDYHIFRSSDDSRIWKPFRPNTQTAADTDVTIPQLTLHHPIEIVKIVAVDTFNLPTIPCYNVLVRDSAVTAQQQVDFQIAKDFYDDYLRIELIIHGLIKAPPRMFVQQIGVRPIEVDLLQNEFNHFIGIYKFRPHHDGGVDIEVYAQDLNSKEVFFWDKFDLTTISPDHGGKMASDDGLCQVTFNDGVVYKNMFARVEKIPTNGDSARYNLVGAVYNIEPFDVLMRKEATVLLSYPKDDTLPEKLGVYSRETLKHNGWSFQGNALNRSQKTITAKLSSLRQVTLIRDTEPPSIMFHYPKDNSFVARKFPTIRASVRDERSGVNDERSITMTLDGEKVIAEYDPEEKVMKYDADDALPLGQHTVTISAVDNCGNSASVTHTFTVVQRNDASDQE